MSRQINQQITLKPQDLLVLFKLLAPNTSLLTYAELSTLLAISASELHASIRRAKLARLILSEPDEAVRLDKKSLKEFILYGARYVFPATYGSITRGIPTAYAAPPLVNLIMQPDELPPVWPTPQGTTRGVAFYPLYPTAPVAAEKDNFLYENLTLFDAIRGGAARERELAANLLSERIA
ncbi:hypothetical protein MGMO_86c00200 [Methyloglobulus morosus KoM1]|uniref:Uncharacterized protein n=1 Tax=Methyloglobulus morosus KoM1 TaxID=1116472 RepID=V5BEZ2_9GAMM|nr:hypothetical protein [Methyloglobulus morosus]ESS71860.1 hypothetical protein MGMO_86c00200 [Methyloglobulus morosus KoM1]